MTLRYVKTFGSWMTSSAQPTKGELNVDYAKQRRTLFEYVFYGSYKIGQPFSDSYKTITKESKLVNVKEFAGKDTIIQSLEDTHVFGFSPASDSDSDWTGRLIEENSAVQVTKKSVLICLDGSPVVNGKTLSRYDYDELSKDKTYTIDLKTDGVLALFTEV